MHVRGLTKRRTITSAKHNTPDSQHKHLFNTLTPQFEEQQKNPNNFFYRGYNTTNSISNNEVVFSDKNCFNKGNQHPFVNLNKPHAKLRIEQHQIFDALVPKEVIIQRIKQRLELDKERNKMNQNNERTTGRIIKNSHRHLEFND